MDKQKLNNKKSEWYNYYINDFQSHRQFQFFSIYYQAREAIINPNINSMLEFGTGRNVTKALVEHFGIQHKSIDFDDERFLPDEKTTIMDYKTDKKYDIVCAFQVLEHNPLSTLKEHLLKMKSISNKYVYISVPYSGRWISFSINCNIAPKLGIHKIFNFCWYRWFFKKIRDIDSYKKRVNPYSPHWWEVGDRNFSKKNFYQLIQSVGLKINKSFHNEMFPYHLFYLLEIDN